MRAHGTRVLMLGWEYPPRFAGGLGKACQGLAQAMARAGAHIYFVLPTFPEKVSERHLEVVGARECLIEAGWPLEVHETQVYASAAPGLVGQPGVSLIGMRSPSSSGTPGSPGLHPYAAPQGPAPERLRPNEAKAEGAHEKVAGSHGSPTRPPTWSFREEALKASSASSPDSNDSSSGEIYGGNLWSEIERFALMTRHLAEAHEVDVVHAHDWMTFPAAFEFQRATGVPVFVHVHATEYDRSGENPNNDVYRIEREGFRQATHIFAVSRYTAGIIERLYGVNKKKITVVYNAPSDDFSATSPLFGAKAGTPRKPQVIFLGRLTFQKGPDHFLRAAALVAKADSQARFILCGTGDMMDQLLTLTHRLGIEDRTHFAGFVDPAAVDEILLNSKVLVMPSVSEPFGLVALEAIRCGMPIIISKQSGVREVLHRALQVDFWDHEKLADQILAALRLTGLSRQLVDEGTDQMRELTWEGSARRVFDTYQRFLNSGGSTYAASIAGGHGH
jgi:glycogen synthase